MARYGCALAWFCALLLAACSLIPEAQFDRWLAVNPERGTAFARFEAVLRTEGVSDVVANYELWIVDRLDPACVTEPFAAPPEDEWRNIVPAIRFVRDHVEPAIGEVRVVSAYRSSAFNACVRGAPQSAHRSFYALDLVPVDRTVSRESLIELLCPVHAREGPVAGIGFGIYTGQRFHIDARSYRGWGADHRGASFPCSPAPS